MRTANAWNVAHDAHAIGCLKHGNVAGISFLELPMLPCQCEMQHCEMGKDCMFSI